MRLESIAPLAILIISTFHQSTTAFLQPISKFSPHLTFIRTKSRKDLTSSLDMSAQQPQTSSGGEGTSYEESTIAIVGVMCPSNDDDDDGENPILRVGVAELFKLYFDELFELGCDLGFQGFQSEWTDLPGKYDFQKRGGLFVAIDIPITKDGGKEEETLFVAPGKDFDNGMSLKDVLTTSKQVVGCIAIRPLTETCGEVKRMYIRKSHRRRGVGKELAKVIIDHAWDEGCQFEEIKLDSLERLEGAVRLYENMGFSRIDPYCECPEEDHVCMNLFKK